MLEEIADYVLLIVVNVFVLRMGISGIRGMAMTIRIGRTLGIILTTLASIVILLTILGLIGLFTW